MDKDSAYMAISGNNFESLIEPDLHEEFENDKHTWFVAPRAPQGKHTSGLFKLEFQGDKYCIKKFAMESSLSQVKCSMKGVNKKQFKNPMPHFQHVLNTKENFRACNQGICTKDQSMATYTQWKNALTYFYPNRKVLTDRRTTVPLDI